MPIFSLQSSIKMFGPKVKSFLVIKTKNDYQKSKLEEIIKFMGKTANIATVNNMNFNKELLKYESDVVNRIKYNSSEGAFEY